MASRKRRGENMLNQERKRLRLENYDYSDEGAYFVTICLNNRSETLFDNDNAKQMIEQWILKLEEKYDNVKMDYYVVMKDHVHMIIIINKKLGVGLSEIIDWFKTMTTNEYIRGVRKGIYEPFDKRFWQRSYNDHIIRIDEDLNEKREYIINNPLKELEKDMNII